ncbi:hypothetical protein DQG13_26970 [Paenibacillus sp. YN15]|nr:hypothetical protein DQG13_26970 [Paenibacillus sp. YN15]
MSWLEAAMYGAVYANLISGFSRGTEETAQHTQDLLEASAVVASSTGRTMERIRSGLLGKTGAIEDLGISVNIATQPTLRTENLLFSEKIEFFRLGGLRGRYLAKMSQFGQLYETITHRVSAKTIKSRK